MFVLFVFVFVFVFVLCRVAQPNKRLSYIPCFTLCVLCLACATAVIFTNRGVIVAPLKHPKSPVRAAHRLTKSHRLVSNKGLELSYDEQRGEKRKARKMLLPAKDKKMQEVLEETYIKVRECTTHERVCVCVHMCVCVCVHVCVHVCDNDAVVERCSQHLLL